MVDIHSPILPGVDHGARSLEQACALVEVAAADGVVHKVSSFLAPAEPHAAGGVGAATRARLLLRSGITHVGSLPSSLTVLFTKRIIMGNTRGL